MKTKSLFTMMATPSLAFSAVINGQGVPAPATPQSSVFGIKLFQGNIWGPCYWGNTEIAIDSALVLNPRVNYCVSTHDIPTTCIGRQMIEHNNVSTAQAYEASHGGLDTKPYLCNVIGYQQDNCPRDTGIEAQYHDANATWSWDHATRIRDDFPGEMWSVKSFQFSCIP